MEHKTLFKLSEGITSPTFIATADVHLQKKLYNEPELEEDLNDNFVRLCDLAIAKKVQYLVIAGDLFENNNVKSYTITFVQAQINRLKENGITTVGQAGDHDLPVKGSNWSLISGVIPVATIPEFSGFDYFDYSTVEHTDLINLLRDNKDTNKVLWIFLHCQFPQLFELAQSKKLIDFNKLDLFDNFPNLQGIIAGDLHFGPETKAYGVNKVAYVGYPGSLGQTDISEGTDSRRVLYCDGQCLQSLDFPQRRKMVRIDFRDDNMINFDISTYLDLCQKEKYKPVFYISWDKKSEDYIHKLYPLYEVGLVHMHQLKIGQKIDEIEDTTADRSEVSTELKIEKALRNCCKKDGEDEELVQLALKVLTSDEPRTVLDTLKTQYNL